MINKKLILLSLAAATMLYSKDVPLDPGIPGDEPIVKEHISPKPKIKSGPLREQLKDMEIDNDYFKVINKDGKMKLIYKKIITNKEKEEIMKNPAKYGLTPDDVVFMNDPEVGFKTKEELDALNSQERDIIAQRELKKSEENRDVEKVLKEHKNKKLTNKDLGLGKKSSKPKSKKKRIATKSSGAYNDDKIEALLVMIEKMEQREQEEKKKKEEEAKKQAKTDIKFRPIKSIKIGKKIFVDVEVILKKSSVINRVANNLINQARPSNQPPPPPPPGSPDKRLDGANPNQQAQNPVRGRIMPVNSGNQYQTTVEPPKIYTLTVGDKIEDWQVTEANDRYIVFKNLNNDKEIKEYY